MRVSRWIGAAVLLAAVAAIGLAARASLATEPIHLDVVGCDLVAAEDYKKHSGQPGDVVVFNVRVSGGGRSLSPGVTVSCEARLEGYEIQHGVVWGAGWVRASEASSLLLDSTAWKTLVFDIQRNGTMGSVWDWTGVRGRLLSGKVVEVRVKVATKLMVLARSDWVGSETVSRELLRRLR